MQLSFTKQDSNIVKTVAIILMYIHHSFFTRIWNCTKKAGAACLIVSVIVPRMLEIGLTKLTWWLPTICSGALVKKQKRY